MLRRYVGLLLVLVAIPCMPQNTRPIDGANALFADPLLDNLLGHWKLTGKLMGRPATHTVDVEWVLNHQFLRIHEVGATDPKTGKPEYEATPMIGYDNMSERYVAHWIDVFGGRFSETFRLRQTRRQRDRLRF